MWVSCPSVTIPGKPRLKPTTTTLSWSYFEIGASVYTFMGCRGHNSAHNKSLSWAISCPDPCNPSLQLIFQMLFRSSFLGVAAVKFTGGGMLDSPAKSSERKIFQAFPLPSWHELTGYSHKHLTQARLHRSPLSSPCVMVVGEHCGWKALRSSLAQGCSSAQLPRLLYQGAWKLLDANF